MKIKLPILIASALAFSNLCHAYSWGQNPITIPILLDHGISIGEISDAHLTCFMKGDSSSSKPSTVQGLMAQVPQAGNGYIRNSEPYTFHGETLKDSTHQGYFSYHFVYDFEAPNAASYIFDNYPLNSKDHEASLSVSVMNSATWYTPDVSNGDDMWLVLLSSEEFPRVVYDEVIQPAPHDAAGNLDSSKEVVGGLAIEVPYNFAETGSAMTLENQKSHHLAKFTLDGAEYARCMQNLLQKRHN